MWAHGALALTLSDAADQPLLEPDPGALPLWSEVTLEALLEDHTDPADLALALTAHGIIESPTKAALTDLPPRDWTRAWMDRFRPMRFGEAIWICPSHVEPDPSWPVVVRLDPGLAFGTGTHPTTALCLAWLDGRDLTGKTVVDYGCGSGVLAIAAARLGSDHVLAVDHDPQAIVATRENAARNGVTERVYACSSDQFEPTGADIVLANILAGTLIRLAEPLKALIADGGDLVLSGILEDQAETVTAAYRDALHPVGRAARDGWVRLDFTRR